MEGVGGVNINQIPKMVKMMSHRTGRYYYKPVEEFPNILSNQVPVSAESGLHNPIVLASVASGVLGVVIVIILIFTIWIRRRCYSTSNGGQNKTEYSTSELGSVVSGSAKSSTRPQNFTDSSRTIMTLVDERPELESSSLQKINEVQSSTIVNHTS